MLRYIRMTSTTKEVPKLEGRIFALLHEWIHPFYSYRIPHTPTPHDRVCTCAYPLFTLRSSRRSPYDEPASVTATQETVYVDSTGKSSSPPVSEVHHHQGVVAPTTDTNTSCTSSALSPSAAFISVDDNTVVYNVRTIGDTTTLTSSTTNVEASSIASSRSMHTSAFLSTFGNLPSLKARWAVRRRRGGRLIPPPQSTETCYRCDICDGLQQAAEDAAAHRDAHIKNRRNEDALEEEDDEAAGEEDVAGAVATENNGKERYGHTTSTDIVNTAMEDADVAELRRLDPFQVEVFGKPSWGALLKRVTREIQGQLVRCKLHSRAASRYAAQATANSDISRQAYRLWVRAEAQRVREEQRLSIQPFAPAANSSTAKNEAAATAAVSPSFSTRTMSPPPPPSSPLPLSSPVSFSLTMSLKQRAIIKEKLDTLHIAAYLARYAVAAYGLPYELNFFTSVRELTKLLAEPHSRYVCANSEEQLKSMRRMLQGEVPDALLECVASRYSLRVGQPCWSLFLDHAAQRVILTFRGSLTASDMVVNVMEGYANVLFEHMQDPDGDPSSSSPYPKRVCTAIPLGLYDSVVEAGAQLLPILSTIHRQYGKYILCVTGHSLGGIQASVFHLLYCGPWRATLRSTSSLLRRTKTLRYPSATVAEASSLMESSNTETAKANAHVPFKKTITCTLAAAPVIEKRVVSVVNMWLAAEEQHSGSRLIAMSHGMDFVTRLQVHSLKETFTRAYNVAPAAAEKPTNAKGQSAATPAEGALPTDVDMATMSDKSGVPVLAVPGSMYNVTAGTRRRYLLAVPPTASAVREQIIISAEAVLQHFPCLYLRSLAELLNRYEAKWNALTGPTIALDSELSTTVSPTNKTEEEQP